MDPTGLHPHVQVVIGLDGLRGLDDAPAHLVGYGPIDAEYARALAFATDAIWQRLVTDPLTGRLEHHDRKKYRPSAALADHVRALWQTCTDPGCDKPAVDSDLDHVVPWPAGQTCAENLAPKCRRHHRLKHEGGWTHQVSTDPTHPPGTIEITSPAGQQYYAHPPDLRRPAGMTTPSGSEPPPDEAAPATAAEPDEPEFPF